MERMSGKFADRMDELNEKMREAYQRYQELQKRLQNQISERGMQGKPKMSGIAGGGFIKAETGD